MRQRGALPWLLLLPAFVLLLAFTHVPAVATLYDSFHSTAKAGRAAVWVGLENYQVMTSDPVFWQALRNNLWFALATIPLSTRHSVLSRSPLSAAQLDSDAWVH